MKITANSFMPVEAKIIIDGKSYTGEEFNSLVEALRAPSLTDDQQVVLEWLKKDVGKYRNISYSVSQVSYLALTPMGKAWGNLSTKQQFQVLAAFAEWGLSNL